MAGLAANRGEERTVAIDATYPKAHRAHRTATGSGVERGRGCPIHCAAGASKGCCRERHERQVARHSADSSAIASEHGHCRAARQRSPGAAPTPTVSETRRKTKGDVPAPPASPVGNSAKSPSDTTSDATRIEIVFGRPKDWRRVASHNGPWRPATTDAQRCFSWLARWLQPSYTGFETQRVPSLETSIEEEYFNEKDTRNCMLYFCCSRYTLCVENFGTKRSAMSNDIIFSRRIMRHRQFQNNLPQAITLSQQSEDEVTRSLGIELSKLAYGMPHFSFDENKNEAIREFS